MKKTDVKRTPSKSKILLFQNHILNWFVSHGRHHFSWREKGLSSYEIIIAEVLLQRTKAETIEKFYPLFLTLFPSWRAIVDSELYFIEQKLRPIGLYRQRAKRLKDLAKEMMNRNGEIPKERKLIEQIPLLGQYIANAIELQLLGRSRPLLDVNMARVLERYFGPRQLADIRYDTYLQNLAHQVVDHEFSKEINWAILDFAAIICKARKPLCESCIMAASCKYFKNTYL